MMEPTEWARPLGTEARKFAVKEVHHTCNKIKQPETSDSDPVDWVELHTASLTSWLVRYTCRWWGQQRKEFLRYTETENVRVERKTESPKTLKEAINGRRYTQRGDQSEGANTWVKDRWSMHDDKRFRKDSWSYSESRTGLIRLPIPSIVTKN